MSTDLSQRQKKRLWLWIACGLVLLGTAFRAAPLTVNRFHSDEALFTTLARSIVDETDPLLKNSRLLVDKPPLAYYVLAISIALGGKSELAVRLPAFLASIITIALVARVSYSIWNSSRSAIIGLWWIAFSPMAISFSPTAFSDSVMVVFFVGSLAAVINRRGFVSGVLAGMAILSKQNALFAIPLVILFAVITPQNTNARARLIAEFAGGLIAIVSAAVLWDVLRQPAVNSWLAGAAANNPGRLSRSTEVWARAEAWEFWLQSTAGNPIIGVAYATGVLAAGFSQVSHFKRWAAIASFSLSAFFVAYLAIHWLVAFPTLDRYMLPLVPVTSILAGRGLDVLWRAIWPHMTHRILKIIAGAALVTVASTTVLDANLASESGIPVGGDHGANDGIDSFAELASRLPEGTVIYSRDLDWLVRCYLYDDYVYPVYLDTPRQFTKDLIAFGETGPSRILLISVSEPTAELKLAARSAGFELEPVFYGLNRDGHETLVAFRIRKTATSNLILRPEIVH